MLALLRRPPSKVYISVIIDIYPLGAKQVGKFIEIRHKKFHLSNIGETGDMHRQAPFGHYLYL